MSRSHDPPQIGYKHMKTLRNEARILWVSKPTCGHWLCHASLIWLTAHVTPVQLHQQPLLDRRAERLAHNESKREFLHRADPRRLTDMSSCTGMDKILIIIIITISSTRFSCQSKQGASADKLQVKAQNPTPCWTRQIQARPNQPWARCSVFIPPPAS